MRIRLISSIRKLFFIVSFTGIISIYFTISNYSDKNDEYGRPLIMRASRIGEPLPIGSPPRRGWMKEVPWQQRAQLHNFPFLIDPNNTCNTESGRVTLLVLIKSAPNNVARRDATRRTYIDYAKKHGISARFVFIVGVRGSRDLGDSLRKEAATTGDILQVDFKDQYYNLTVKLMMGFEWALNVCKHFDFVMSTDDDVIVDVELLVKDLKAVPDRDRSRFMLGKRAYNEGPNRGEDNKWFIPKDMFPGEYPVFPYGHGYIMSHAVLERVYSQSKVTPAMVPFDDVYCGILLDKLGIEIIQRIEYFRTHHPLKKMQDYLVIEVPVSKSLDAWKEFGKNVQFGFHWTILRI